MGQETRNQIGYRKLLVWSESHQLTLLIYKITAKFPREELFGLTSQLRRAAVSITANIVEGYARASKKERLQFLYISYGSLSETEYYLDLSKDLRYLTESEYMNLIEHRQTVGKLLYGLIIATKRQIA